MVISKKGSELSRAERKSKKRKAEDAIPDLPGDNENVEASEAGTAFRAEKPAKKRSRSEEENNAVGDGLESETKAAKREKKKKKRKTEDGGAIVVEEDPSAEQAKKSNKDKKDKKAKHDAQPPETDAQGSTITIAKHSTETTEEAEPKKSKKERKAERKAKEAAEAAMVRSKEPVAINSASTPAGDAITTTVQTGEEAKTKRKNNRNREKKRMVKAEGEETKPARFIVFIGNLPFSATTESITKHFAKIKPKSVRHLTQKDNPTKSRGSAFVEFDGYDHMKTCLKLFHHSLFDDGISPARKINVELTVGGGGNTKDRRAKIEEKNQRLNEQRVRRIQEEEKAKYAKAAAGTPDESGIHPSRRAMVSGA